MRKGIHVTHGQTPAGRPPHATETVAVLGAGGTMGFAMARNIARAGIEVRAWNRSRAKAEPLARGVGPAARAGPPAARPGRAPLKAGAVRHGDKDFSATYLTSKPERAA
jgi:NAD(P)-dependent dehydrogenase (short-subunit alcohol dehydrogenase family)